MSHLSIPTTPARPLPAIYLPDDESDALPVYVSEEDYWEDYYEAEAAYEWNNGILEEKPVSDFETAWEYRWFWKLLEHYLTVHPLAKAIPLDMGFRLALKNKIVIRKPDMALVLNSNRVPLRRLDCTFHGVYDLCVEALSDKEHGAVERDTVVKKGEYAAGGVQEYYILHHNPKHRAFYFLNAQGIYEPITPKDGVIHSRILPGFRFRPEDLERRPTQAALMADPVYQDFVLPDWQAEIEARRQAEQRAAAAEAELARLRALLAEKNTE